MAISRIDQIIAVLGNAVTAETEGEVDYAATYALLCEARNHFAALGHIYIPPSLDLCDTSKHLRAYSDECDNDAPASDTPVEVSASENFAAAGVTNRSVEGRISPILREKEPQSLEESGAVLRYEYEEIRMLLEKVVRANTGMERREDPGNEPPSKTASFSTVSLWTQARKAFSLHVYPIREDRDTRHWVLPKPTMRSHHMAELRRRRQLRTGISPIKRHCTVDSDHNDDDLKDPAHRSSRRRAQVTKEILYLLGDVEDEGHHMLSFVDKQDDDILTHAPASHLLKSKRRQRAVRPASENLHGRAHSRGRGNRKLLSSRGLLNSRHVYIRCPRPLGRCNPIRKFSRPLQSTSLYRWKSEKIPARGITGDIPRPRQAGLLTSRIHDSGGEAEQVQEFSSKDARLASIGVPRTIEPIILQRNASTGSRASISKKRPFRRLARTGSAVLTPSSGAAAVDEDFWLQYLTMDARLMAEKKLLRKKLAGARKQVVLQSSQLSLCFHLIDGAVTRECENLGFGISSSSKVRSPKRQSMLQRSNSTKEREAGEWVQAQQEIERQMLLLKPLEETRQNLFCVGWKLVDKEEEKEDDTMPKTKAQMLRDEATKQYIQKLAVKCGEGKAAHGDKNLQDSTLHSSSILQARTRATTQPPKPEGGVNDFTSTAHLKLRPPTAPTARRVQGDSPRMVSGSRRPHSLSQSLRPTSAPTQQHNPRPPSTKKIMSRAPILVEELHKDCGAPSREKSEGRKLYPAPKTVRDEFRHYLAHDTDQLISSTLWRRSSSPSRQPDDPDEGKHAPQTATQVDRQGQVTYADAPDGNRTPFATSAHSKSSINPLSGVSHEAEDSHDIHDLANRLHALKKLAFLRTLRKQTDILASKTLQRSTGPTRGKSHDIRELGMQVQRLRAEMAR